VLRSPLAWSLVLHAASRVVFYLVGVRFDDTPLYGFMQFVDAPRLRDDLADSLFYLHMQPPLFNAFLGAVLKLAPSEAERDVFWGCFVAFGVALHVSLYALVRVMGTGRVSAAAGALLFSVSPAAICYESWLFYSYPLAALLCATAALLPRYVARRSILAGLLFFTLIAALALTYALFHLFWCAAVLGLVLAAVPGRDRRRTLSAALPLLLVVALYAKNLILFGQFTASSFFGMNLASITVHNTPPAELAALIGRGTLSPLARIPAFSPLESYPPQLLQPPGLPAPILGIPTKSSETPNLNHFSYLNISHRYLVEGIALIRARPGIYLHNVVLAFALHALPATRYPFFVVNREAIAGWDRAWQIFPGGVLAALRPDSAPVNRSDPRSLALHVAWVWMALLAVVLVRSTTEGLRALRDPRPQPRAAMLLFIAFCVGYVTLLSNLIELGENNRFRFVIDPLIWAAAWGWADGRIRRRLSSRARADRAQSASHAAGTQTP
jgi:hypothetical protein